MGMCPYICVSIHVYIYLCTDMLKMCPAYKYEKEVDNTF